MTDAGAAAHRGLPFFGGPIICPPLPSSVHVRATLTLERPIHVADTQGEGLTYAQTGVGEEAHQRRIHRAGHLLAFVGQQLDLTDAQIHLVVVRIHDLGVVTFSIGFSTIHRWSCAYSSTPPMTTLTMLRMLRGRSGRGDLPSGSSAG